MVGGRGQFRVRASKGIHLVVPRNRINSATGIITRTEKSLLFIIPWGSHWIIGTTDTDWDLDLAHPAASAGRHRLPARPRQRAAGRPAHPRGRRRRLRRAAAAAGRRVRLDRQAVPRARRRLARCRGLTVDRRRQVHDLPGHGQGRRRRRRARARAQRCRRSCTEDVPLLGADGYLGAVEHPAPTRRADRAAASARSSTCSSRYGSLMAELLELIAERPELGEPLAGAPEYLQGRGAATPPRTRAPCTWTTSSPGAPGSPSRPGTAATAAAPEVADAGRAGARLGRGRRRPRGRALPRAGRGRARVASTSPTT